MEMMMSTLTTSTGKRGDITGAQYFIHYKGIH